MKLRLFENSIRFRLSQADVTRFTNEGAIEAALWFNTHSVLRYRLSFASGALASSFDGKTVAIFLPEKEAREWLATDRESMGGNAGPLKISIEKDYQCLHRDGAEDKGNFPNPLKVES
jgi:hypothetical protein